MGGKTDTDQWIRAGLEALAHGDSHARAAEPSDLRMSVISYDGAIEATIAGYLRDGPGSTHAGAMAEKARARGSTFWDKSRWLIDESGMQVAYSANDLNAIRSARNEIQHGGTWWIPPVEVVADAEALTIAVVGAIVGPTAVPVVEGGRPAVRNVPAHVGREPLLKPDAGAVGEIAVGIGLSAAADRRPIVMAAWQLARLNRPGRCRRALSASRAPSRRAWSGRVWTKRSGGSRVRRAQPRT